MLINREDNLQRVARTELVLNIAYGVMCLILFVIIVVYVSKSAWGESSALNSAKIVLKWLTTLSIAVLMLISLCRVNRVVQKRGLLSNLRVVYLLAASFLLY
jgi:hypothetical protein